MKILPVPSKMGKTEAPKVKQGLDVKHQNKQNTTKFPKTHIVFFDSCCCPSEPCDSPEEEEEEDGCFREDEYQ